MFENASKSGLGAGIIIEHENKILLVQINYGKAIGKWILPGGTVDKGEHPEDAAQRELFEETGLKGTTVGLVGVRHRLQPEQGFDANVYYVFAGRLMPKELEKPESRLVWDKEELQNVKFWDKEPLQESPDVADMTKFFINKLNNSSALAVKQTNPNSGKYQDSVYCF